MVTRDYLYQMFGNFWNQVWQEPSLLEAATSAYREVYNQLETERRDLDAYLNRNEIPLSFFRHFSYKAAKEEEFRPAYRRLGTFNMDAGVKLDTLEDSPNAWSLDAGAQSIELILDKPVNPGVIWQRGQDFDFQDGVITFSKDPFASGFMSSVRSVDGEIKRTCKFWLCNTNFDIKAVSQFFSIYFGIQTATTPYYKRIANCVWDLALEGGTVGNMTAYLCAVADTDVATTDGTVQDIWNEQGRTFIATETKIYSAPLPGAASVALRQSVKRGDNIFNTVTIVRGTGTADVSQFPMLHLGREFLNVKYTGGISLENKEFIITNSHFPIGGLPDTVQKYWTDVDADMEARGLDLWQLETSGQSSPYKLNPFEFIRQNILKTNSVFIGLSRTAVPQQSVNLRLINYLLDYMPAGTTFFLYIYGETDVESLTSREMTDLDGAEAFLTLDVKETNVFETLDYNGAGHKLW